MKNSNYLIDFLYKLDCLISEINKLNSKIRLYKNNASIFGISYNVKFSIEPDYFLKLRDFLHDKIDKGSAYDKKIVDLKRKFQQEYLYLKISIRKEIQRIEQAQEKEMNRVVYKAIYFAKWENEIYLRDSVNVKSSIFEAFIGIAKYRELCYQNHQLKADLIEKEYFENKFPQKNIFELVNLIENADVKDGNLLCLQEDMIKAFMVDRNVIKRNNVDKWKPATLIPDGVFEKKSHYKILNKNLLKENKEIQAKLKNNRFILENEKNLTVSKLIRLNSKLSKIVNPLVNVQN